MTLDLVASKQTADNETKCRLNQRRKIFHFDEFLRNFNSLKVYHAARERERGGIFPLGIIQIIALLCNCRACYGVSGINPATRRRKLTEKFYVGENLLHSSSSALLQLRGKFIKHFSLKIARAGIDFPAIAFIHMEHKNYYFIVNSWDFFAPSTNEHISISLLTWRWSYLRISAPAESCERKGNKHILLLVYHFIVSITGVLGRIDFPSIPPFVS